MLWLLIQYILKAALRDRLFLSFIVLLGVGVSLSMFLGSSAITETDEFSLIFAGSGLRLATNLTLILFVVFYMRRAFESRDIEYLLSRPITKLQFLLSHFTAFVFIAFIASVLVMLVVAFMPSQVTHTPIILWGVSLWLELSIVATVALFFSLILSSAVTSSMAVIAFYVLARLIGDILGIIEAGVSGGVSVFLEKLMFIISVIIPRFDLLAQSAWLLYPIPDDINLPLIFGQGVIFMGLIVSAAYMDLNKKQF